MRLSGLKVGGVRFRRQYPIGPYCTEFYCPSARLIIDVNGPTHEGEEYDERRTAWLESRGHGVFRLSVADIDEDLDLVVETILRELEQLGSTRALR